jgi:hypothetical protein
MQKHRTLDLLSQFNFSGTLATLVLWRLSYGSNVWVAAKIFAQSAAKNAHTGAMDDANARQAGQKSAIKEPFDLGLGLVGCAADYVDLGGHVIRIVVHGRDGNASTLSCGFKGRDNFDGLDLRNIFNGSTHLQLAHGDLECLCIDDTVDACLTPKGLEFN